MHPGASERLVETVLELAAPQPDDRCLDLYAGVGLFTDALASRTSEPVVAVELDARASAAAAENVPAATVVTARVERWLGQQQRDGFDVVVLDPPRRGAGAAVVDAIAGLGPRVVCYVACDPASLARDVKTFAAHGYRLAQLRAFDLFPMTAHVECVGLLERT